MTMQRYRLIRDRESACTCEVVQHPKGHLVIDRDALADIARFKTALAELYATVVGECPSLLNEDSGGNSRLALEIEDLLK
jgi:hypothetical protein